MPLTDTALRNARPGPKPQKLFAGGGLFLLLNPTGSRWWRFKYRFGGKEKLLSLGVYPDVSLKEARQRRDDCRKTLSNGLDPSDTRKATHAGDALPAADTLETVAREWYAKQRPSWTPGHSKTVLRRLELYVFPVLGTHSITDISATHLLGILRLLEARAVHETAHRVLNLCQQVCRYAIATGRIRDDPSAALRGALTPVTTRHFSAVTEPKDIAPLLRILDGYQGTPVVVSALRLAPLVFVRPGELRKARWAHIDLDTAEWRYLVTKTQTPHIVPLATQAVAVLRTLHPLTSHGVFVFPGSRNNGRPMSENAITAAMRTMGIPADRMSGHGFRAMAYTVLAEVLRFPQDLIDHQLAHVVKNPLGQAYNRTTHLPERQRMMQAWADYLDTLRHETQP
ncbi:MAG: integrase arm-type DNA-binding domain-containing protein [Acidobacteria bacterium]|nr:integrase arm-type DNA-binding domain-containing protein [Acidobacteriota bacterium]